MLTWEVEEGVGCTGLHIPRIAASSPCQPLICGLNLFVWGTKPSSSILLLPIAARSKAEDLVPRLTVTEAVTSIPAPSTQTQVTEKIVT